MPLAWSVVTPVFSNFEVPFDHSANISNSTSFRTNFGCTPPAFTVLKKLTGHAPAVGSALPGSPLSLIWVDRALSFREHLYSAAANNTQAST